MGTKFFFIGLFFFLLASASFLPAQDYVINVQHYGVEEGLSHRFVRETFQDNQGLIWISTEYGLNRFDGYNFTWFTKEKNGLASNLIRKVIQEPSGWLWVFSAKEGQELGWNFIDLLNPYTLEVVPWSERYATFSPEAIRKCLSAPDGEIFCQLKQGALWKLDVHGQLSKITLPLLQNFSLQYISQGKTLWGIEKEEDSVNWIEMDIEGSILKKFKHSVGAILYPLGEDKAGRFCYGNRFFWESVDFFSIDSLGRTHPMDLTGNASGHIGPKDLTGYQRMDINPFDQSVWWMSPHTIGVKFPNTEKMLFIHEEYQGGYPGHVLFDDAGAAWLSRPTGIYRIEVKPSKFKNLLYKKYPDTGENPHVQCRGILEADDGNIFINAQHGTYLVTPEGIILDDNFLNTPVDLTIAGLYRDRAGYLWFGADSPVRKDACSNELHYYPRPAAYPKFNTWAIYQDTSGRMWFGGLNGSFAYMDVGKDTLELFNDYAGYEELKKASIHSFYEDHLGGIWLATTQGLYALDVNQKKILNHYSTGGAGRFFLPYDNIYDIYQDKSGTFWLATGGGGLLKIPEERLMEEDTASITQFTKANGLSSNVLYGIYEDDYNNLWISSEYGIILFDKTTEQSKAYLVKDGLPHNEFNRISHYKAKSGKLYFGGLNGVTTFHPHDFLTKEKHNHTPLVLLDIQQFDKLENRLVNKKKSFEQTQKIVLRPGDRMLNVEFALLEYGESDRIRYAYRVEGLDESWNFSRQNHLMLTGLPYGNFILKIKGQAANGEFSSQPLVIPIQVLKPFYFKGWFLILSGLGFILIGWAIFKVRIFELQKQKRTLKKALEKQTRAVLHKNQLLSEQTEELQRLDKVKSRFFANVSHELRTPLTLILGPVKMVLKRNRLEEKDFSLLENARQNGQNLLKLINELLDLSKMESNKLELHETPVTLYPLLRRYCSAFESQAHVMGISLTQDYQANENLEVLIDEEKFEKIVYNYLSNALKFTPNGGSVKIHLEEQEKTLLLSVTDNGKGIHPDDLPNIFKRFFQTSRPDAPAEGGTGIGLALVQEFASVLEGKVWVKSKLQEGSTFYFEWPKKESHVMEREALPISNDLWGINHVSNGNVVGVAAKMESGTRISEREVAEVVTIANQPAERLSRPTILVVEDNPDMSHYICQILEPQFNLMTAANGKEALLRLTEPTTAPQPSAAVNNLPDIILSDVMMPLMDGFQLLEVLKSDNRYRRIPVIMLTARADVQDKLKALRIGVDDYLRKPFEEEELLVRIDNLLERYRERQAYIEDCAPEGLTKTEEVLQLPGFNHPTSPGEADWLEELETLVKKEVQNDLLTVDWLAPKLFLSTRQLRRRIRSLTGLSPSQYIKEVRLQEARRILEDRQEKTVQDVAWAVSFRDSKYFSQLFKDRFGKLPSEYFL
ncbi:MAG: response regulator [Lewinellaceae bacterium]|nr:response regulator [Lewinellaceae bacterium]